MSDESGILPSIKILTRMGNNGKIDAAVCSVKISEN